MGFTGVMGYNIGSPVAVNYRTNTQAQGGRARLATVNNYIIVSWPSMQMEGFSMPTIKYHQEDWSQWPRVEGVWYIYGLHLKDSDEIRYVGSTVDVHQRYEQHLCSPGKSTKEWIGRNKMDVRIRVLARVSSDHKGKERRTAQEYSQKGHRLFNNRRPRKLTKKERDSAVKVWLSRLGL